MKNEQYATASVGLNKYNGNMRYTLISRGERSMKMRMKSLCPFSSKRAMLELLGAAFFILHSSFFISCSDWDDHFDAGASMLDSQHATLWQNIESNANLSQFAALLKQTGYDQKLSASQTFTVWAPVNGSFDYNTLAAYNNERLIREFLENHIARNNFQATGTIANNVYMLNEKKMLFSGSADYSIQGIMLDQKNLSSSNGTLHIIRGSVPFLSSIYESLNNYDFALDSISAYIHSFDEKKIDEDLSKKGPVTNGEQTYLDTVYYERNTLFDYYDAYINSEDSSYTMLMPTNRAWNSATSRIRSYCNYVPQFDFMEDVVEKKAVRVKLQDAEALSDSITKMYLMGALFFNNNIYDNRKLATFTEGATLGCDSLMTTRDFKMYADDAADLFVGATRVAKSNGNIWVTDSLRIPTWTVWNPEIRIEAEYSSYWAGYNNVKDMPTVREITRQNEEVSGKVSNGYFIEVTPQSKAVNPDMYFYLPNVRSTEYSIYVVFVPANINSKYYAEELKKNHLDFILGYADATGKSTEITFKDIDTNVDSLQNVAGMTAMVDTTYVGDFTFPMSYLGLSTSDQVYAPYLRIRSRVNNKQTAIYDRTLRIDCIILRPKELDDRLKAQPGYMYDRGWYRN